MTDFKSNKPGKIIGELSSQRVDPTISYALIWQAVMAVFFSLIIIFIYIAIRFKNWQYGLGGVMALFHDTLIIITFFTLFHGICLSAWKLTSRSSQPCLPLSVTRSWIRSSSSTGSVNIRALYPKRDLAVNINAAINSTLGRTINTSGVTLVVLDRDLHLWWGSAAEDLRSP